MRITPWREHMQLLGVCLQVSIFLSFQERLQFIPAVEKPLLTAVIWHSEPFYSLFAAFKETLLRPLFSENMFFSHSTEPLHSGR